jgi:hypothetical protein
MLLLHPDSVSLDAVPLAGVVSVAVDRAAEAPVVEFSDAGPHAVFADVPAQRVTVTLVQELAREDLGPRPGTPGASASLVFGTEPAPGARLTLRITLAAGGADAVRRRATIDAVLLSSAHAVKPARGGAPGSARGSATRTLVFVALSADGAADPVVWEE